MWCKTDLVQANPLYISRAMSNFYGTEIKIWYGFGPVGNTKKGNFEPIMSNL